MVWLKRISTIVSATLILVLGATGVVASDLKSKKKVRPVTVIVHRVAQISDLDHSVLFLTKDRADFYAVLQIGDSHMKSKTYSTDDGRPYWTLTGFSDKAIVPIRIKLMDRDGGLESKDDHVDINPIPNEKDLMLWFNTSTGQISGDVIGHAGQILHSIGYGDQSLGEIWFSIQ